MNSEVIIGIAAGGGCILYALGWAMLVKTKKGKRAVVWLVALSLGLFALFMWAKTLGELSIFANIALATLTVYIIMKWQTSEG